MEKSSRLGAPRGGDVVGTSGAGSGGVRIGVVTGIGKCEWRIVLTDSFTGGIMASCLCPKR